MYKLYGDGLHDDTCAIQALIDEGKCGVCLPMPEVCYLISRPLELPSDFKLELPRFAEIKLAPNSNCVMLRNKLLPGGGGHLREGHSPLFNGIDEYPRDIAFKNIAVEGGVWNFNNLEQKPNPIRTRDFTPYGFSGFGIMFYNVRGLTLRSLTLKDPTTFGAVLDKVSYFTVDDITFDYNYGNPNATNMDGIHMNGNCHFGRITNLKGACYDDLVAMNSDEGSCGPITNIDIDGIYTEDCHSAVRILSVNNLVENITIKNVHGTFYQYCIGITKYYKGEVTGRFDAIHIADVYASKAKRIEAYGKKPTAKIYPLIYVEKGVNIGLLKIENVHRNEKNVPISTVYVGADAKIEHLTLKDIHTYNNTDGEMPLFDCHGEVANLSKSNLTADGEEV